MTRPNQKASERPTLTSLLSALSITTDDIREGETPDFEFLIAGRSIGVEVTMFQSGTIAGAGLKRRQVEAAWEQLQHASRAVQAENPDLRDVNVGLMFHDVAPGRKEHPSFIAEVTAFIRARTDTLTKDNQTYWAWQFTSPLMAKYLRTLYLLRSEFAEWYSNIVAGWVARPDSTLVEIVQEKSSKAYRATDGLWLAVQCSHRISETLLTINGPYDFDGAPELAVALRQSPFERVFVLTFTGIFQWTLTSGWLALTPPQAIGERTSLEALKSILDDPEWLADPKPKPRKSLGRFSKN